MAPALCPKAGMPCLREAHIIITTERLHYLWAVAETGSFSAAGRRLGVSGAAVQQVIRHFEQDLDAPLFRRSPGRSPVLTDLGRQFYFHALDIIPRLEGLENLAATRGQGQEGQLRIGLHGFVMFPEVRAALVELQQAFPLLEIFLYDGEDSVLHCDKLRQLDSSARHTVDILLAPARLRYDHGGQSVMAGRIIWRVVAAADHPLSRIRGSLSLDDLLRHRHSCPCRASSVPMPFTTVSASAAIWCITAGGHGLCGLPGPAGPPFCGTGSPQAAGTGL